MGRRPPITSSLGDLETAVNGDLCSNSRAGCTLPRQHDTTYSARSAFTPSRTVLNFLSSHWARRLTALACILTLFSLLPASTPPVRAQSTTQHTVSWDSRSLLIDGRRVFLFSG